MSTNCVTDQSILQSILDISIAVGTIGAVLVALFGDALRNKIFPPKLSLSLADERGEATKLSLTFPGSNQPPRIEDARYYHLRVSNARRWSPASNTRIVLLRLEEPGPDGNFKVRWTGDIPFNWRHSTVFPPFRDVGPDAYADLCSVVNGNWLELQVLTTPISLEARRDRETSMVVSVQAQSTQANSDVLRLHISWDGQFTTGAEEMRNHLVIKAEV